MWLQWAMGVSLAAAIMLIVYAIRFLSEAKSAIRQTAESAAAVQQQLERTAGETERFMQASTAVMRELQVKLQAADAWFEAAAETGQAASRVSRSVHAVSRSVEKTLQEADRAVLSSRDTVSDLVELTTTGLHLWQRWQASRQSKPKE